MQILIADLMHPSIVPMLEGAGFGVNYQPAITRNEIIAQIGSYAGIVIRSKTTIDEEILQAATNLQFICRAGAGLDQIDVESVYRRKIQLFNAPEGNRDAVAEHAVAMLLSLLNHIHVADRQVRSGIWNREGNRGTELGGKTVGMIGYGNTGKAFARRLSAFGCRVLAYDKYLSNFSDAYAMEAPMNEIFAQTDVLSLHVPLTPETNRLIDLAFLNQFRKNIYLINTSRGEIAALNVLQHAIQSGKLLGACLDVLENEKLATLSPEQQAAFDYLKQSNQVLFSPHVAGWTHESYVRINQVLVEKIKAWKKPHPSPPQ